MTRIDITDLTPQRELTPDEQKALRGGWSWGVMPYSATYASADPDDGGEIVASKAKSQAEKRLDQQRKALASNFGG